MPRKTKIIFIIVFLFVGAVMLGIYFYNKNKSTNTEGETTNFYQKFNPFGSSKNSDINNDGDGDDETKTTTTDITSTSKLKKLTDFAVSGAVSFDETKSEDTNESTHSIKYVERATGHIYQMNLDTKTSGKISNSTIPAVYEAIFDSEGKSVIYRYVSSGEKTITSFLATLSGASEFLNSDILEISLSPKKDRFFFIIKNSNGVIGTIKSFNETKTTQVFTSPFSEWLPQWVSDQTIYLTTKPSYLFEGSVFSLNTTNGTLTKIFGGINGLTTLSDGTGQKVLYGASTNSGPALNIFDVKEHLSTDLDLYGLPEKCIWSKDNINIYCAVPKTVTSIEYPDSWYQGIVSFDDYFIRINSNTGEKSTITYNENDVSIDATKLMLDKEEDNLFFINKKDYTLWQLDI